MRPFRLLALTLLVSTAPLLSARALAGQTAAATTGTDHPAERPPVTRTAEACAELVAQVGAHPDSFTVSPPATRSIVIPPVDGVPWNAAGQVESVTLLVDARGRVVEDSITIAPTISSRRYDRALREVLGRFQYDPAVYQGCAVPGRARLLVTLPQRR